jgi:hypothetical protein
MPGAPAEARWRRERERAAAAGMLTATEAARRAGVPRHMIKKWEALGLIRNYGAGGKGSVALYAWDEVRTAPARRVNLRARGGCSTDGCERPHWARGLCDRHYRQARAAAGLVTPSAPPSTSQNADRALQAGRMLHPPQSLPFRALARTCETCGVLVTTPDGLLRKDAGPLPACPRCRLVWVGDYQRRLQSRLADRAHNRAKEWTGPELEVAAREDLSVRQVAEMLGRTFHGVRWARSRLQVDPRKDRLASLPNGRPWRAGPL